MCTLLAAGGVRLSAFHSGAFMMTYRWEPSPVTSALSSVNNMSHSHSKEGPFVHGRVLQGRVCGLSLSTTGPPTPVEGVLQADTAGVRLQLIKSQSLELWGGKTCRQIFFFFFILCIIFTFHLFTSDIGTCLIAFGHLCIVNQPHDTERVLKRPRLAKTLI